MAQEFAKKFYNSKAWRECRASYIISVNHLCEHCLRDGKHVPGYIVHHIKHLSPLNINNPDITLNHDNLEYVCKECHEVIHYGKPKRATRNGTKFNESGELVEVDDEGDRG